jgi:hypothetical protein
MDQLSSPGCSRMKHSVDEASSPEQLAPFLLLELASAWGSALF